MVDGKPVTWPPLRVLRRVTPADLENGRFRGDSTAPAADPWIAPATLGWLLTAVAAALLLGAGLCAAQRLRPRGLRLRRPGAAASPLTAALRSIERAQAMPPHTRRTALDFLAAALEDAGRPELARRARLLAWAPEPPEAEEMHGLAETAGEAA
jgi:hypothetical protein